MSTHKYDIIINGSGPAGTACALALKESGLRVLVIDKSIFPRDKICGDAIPNTVPKALRSLDDRYLESLRQFPDKATINSCKVVAPSGKSVTLNFKLEGYASSRIDFDQFMTEMAQRESGAEFLFGNGVKDIQYNGDGINVTTTDEQHYQCKLIIGCDGAHSIVRKTLTSTLIDHNHHIGAVRAYYKHVGDVQPNTMEIHILKGFMPGYFWIFPLTKNVCNTGFGMVSKAVADKKINLRKSLTEIISHHEHIRNRFLAAIPLEDPTGFGLPTGSRIVPISGKNFLLAGDAASLIDPATGEGIGNAMISGIIAGNQAKECFLQNDFSAEFMKSYDTAIHKKFLKEMKYKYFMQKVVGEKAWLANLAISLAADVPWVKKQLQKLF